ncbi:hypothetical protein F8M49_20670 [Rhodococcus zopfii]|uniref:Uncharacterized protein n=1 Tax=Rhodococcus zopfii TaxID=43772 RepID=A0ABU3WT11_9NOCA|nr:hypothetical protein [Rhodococcus zopfii]
MNTITNRHGDTITVGQLWTDPAKRRAIRTLRVDAIEDNGSWGHRALCTVLYSHDLDTEVTTEPGRTVGIKIDSLHTTPAGNGYQLIHSARQAWADGARTKGWDTDDDWPYRSVAVFCDTCGGEAQADMLAHYREQAFAGLRAICNDYGWLCTDRGDWCPNCAPAVTR